ncbi:hypothetical protein HBH70_095280 [Parastagonospora nodorum]|nr:hypothetical protein HBH70_095280 [Parastagonospora nodorum]
MTEEQYQGIPESVMIEFEPSPDIPNSFLLVSEAGSGCHVDAYFCLPKDAVAATQAREQGNVADKVSALMSTLQVVKIACPIGLDGIRDEVIALKAIREQQPEGVCLPFFELTAVDTFSPTQNWIATSTLSICCDLATLLERYQTMPEPLVWLIFWQLRKALHFLHNTCDPPMIHNDLHAGNVVLGYAEGSELLQVKVIDFGLARLDDSNCPVNRFRRDYSGLADIMDKVMHGSNLNYMGCNMCKHLPDPNGQGPMLHSFHWLINEMLWTAGNERSYGLLCKRFGPFAHRQILSMPQAARTQIRDMILGVTRPRSEVMHTKITELLTAKAQDFAQTACSESTI